jgi:ABC-2 type transport system ATP-binding protein
MVPSATTRTPAVEARGLVRRFGEVTAVDGLDLTIRQGGCFGLLGPNGAGKTTTVSVLTTLLPPTGGSVHVLGRDVVVERADLRSEIGLVFQESTLDPELTPREHLDLYARLYHLPERRARVEELLDLVDLTADANRIVRGLSGGMKRRLEIARGLLHRPRLLFLDEPTLGLDVRTRAAIWEHLRSLRTAMQTTIFLTTHSMEEADALCDELAIIDRGRVVAVGSPEALKTALGGDVVRIELERSDGAAERLERCAGVNAVTREESADGAARWCITIRDGPRQVAALIEAARPFGVVEVMLHRPTLEHVFLHHTGHPFESAA